MSIVEDFPWGWLTLCQKDHALGELYYLPQPVNDRGEIDTQAEGAEV